MIRNNEGTIGSYSVKDIKKFMSQLTKFSMVGLFNTGLNYLLYSTQVFIGIHYIVANAIAWGIGVFVSYLLNSKLVFSAKLSRESVIKTYVVYGISFSVTTVGLYILIDLLSVSEYLAPLIMLVFTIPFNFLAMKFWAIGKKPVKLIVFDLDGTLFETHPGMLSSIQSVLLYNGLDKPDDVFKEKLMSGVPSSMLLKECYNLTENRLRKIVQEYRGHYQQFGAYECKPYPGIKQLLMKLSRSGQRMAIASLKREEVLNEIVGDKGVEEFFDVVVGNDFDCSLTKDVILKTVIEEMGFSADDTILIGDSYYDYDAARVIGCEFIGVTYGYGFSDEERNRLQRVTFVDDVKGIEEQLKI